jgi:hypothetical protein
MATKNKKHAKNQNANGTTGIGRWYRQRKADGEFNKRTGLCVVNFFPGAGKARFDTPIQAIGIGIMGVLWYRLKQAGTQLLRTMPFRGYTADMRSDGTAVYGGDRGVEFSYDLGARPVPNARGRVLDVNKHDGLILRGMTMDKAVDRVVAKPWELPIMPAFPGILAGFSAIPEFCESPALLAMACKRLNCSPKELAKNPLREQYLHTIFRDSALAPEHADNHTGGYLFPVDLLVGQDLGCCAFYEDYRRLLGVTTWNPAREIHDLGRNALKARGFDRGHLAALNEPQLDGVFKKMREKLGAYAGAFTLEELQEALVEGQPPRKADGTTLQIAIGGVEYLKLLRSYLTPDVAEQATDQDLLIAAADLNEPLVLSQVARPQVIQLQSLPVEEANGWTPEVLGRKILAELEVDNLRARPRKERKRGTGTDAKPALVSDVRQQAVGNADVAQVA